MGHVEEAARGIRRRVLEHVIKNGGGYLSQACSSAEILASLYLRILHLGPSQGPAIPEPFAGAPGPGNRSPQSGGRYNGPRTPQFDRFFFSPVHYSLVLYSTLIEVGRMDPEGLAQFNQDGSTVEMIGAEHSPGIEVTAGSLGQCLSQACGVAMARKLRGDSGLVWVLMSDGELQEGQTWEAFAAAHHHGLSNLRVMFEMNGQQCDGPIDGVMTVEPAAARLTAFGATVCEVDGHDVAALYAAAQTDPTGGPLAVLARTDPCRGIPLLDERRPKLHYLRFKSEAERSAYRALLEEM